MIDLVEALKTLLIERKATTQEDLCTALQQQGYEINQSKVSRLLRKIGAVKILNPDGKVAYVLLKEPSPPSMNAPLHQLIIDIVANETTIVISTSPGSASMIARYLDYLDQLDILGTIAGDDTIFIVPKSIKHTQIIAEKIKNFLLK